MEQEFSPRRCKDTRKPPADQCPEVAFYRCPACKALYPVTGGKDLENKQIQCCGHMAERLIPTPAASAADIMAVSYEITGGYNDNTVRVSWKSKPYGRRPEWVYLVYVYDPEAGLIEMPLDKMTAHWQSGGKKPV